MQSHHHKNYVLYLKSCRAKISRRVREVVGTIFLIVSILLGMVVARAEINIGLPLSPSWNTALQGGFVMNMATDAHGCVWVATEGQGVWRYDSLESTPNRRWKQFTSANTQGKLGDDDCYALACDALGRLWVGTSRHGVSVFNGQEWASYGPVTGPLGSHVIALNTNPVDGDVWGATEAGLFRYSLQKKTWSYVTRANGLPSDQADCIAFSAKGDLFIGTECDGLIVSASASKFKSWRSVPGSEGLSGSAVGSGLPGQQINCVMVAPSGFIYVGTTQGLGLSRDNGLTWSFKRGADWKQKAADRYKVLPIQDNKHLGDLLSEDYVTCLADDGEGNIIVGHRQTGLEKFDGTIERRTQVESHREDAATFVQSFLTLANRGLLVGSYGNGLKLSPFSHDAGVITKTSNGVNLSLTVPVPDLPKAALPPDLPKLLLLQSKIAALKPTALVDRRAIFFNDDWVTQGDWVGRYGRQYTLLCAAAAPFDDNFTTDTRINVTGEAGPHVKKGDGMRQWIGQITTKDPRMPYNPFRGFRRQSEWDDHGEAYGNSFEGPDLWITVTIPDGLFRVSVYFVNDDGHSRDESRRDYTLNVYPFQEDISKVLVSSPLARTRIHQFYGGVYKTFHFSGPGSYYFNVSRNGSHNTLVNAVLIDRLTGSPESPDMGVLPDMGKISYNFPDADKVLPVDAFLFDKALAHVKSQTPEVLNWNRQKVMDAAVKTWSLLNRKADAADYEKLQIEFRMQCYRAISNLGIPAKVRREDWRWTTHLWDLDDRDIFDTTMQRAHEAFLLLNPALKNVDF